MRQLLDSGCVKVADWYLDEDGKVKLDFPASIEDMPGTLIIANANEVMVVSSTSHYGPMIRDFRGTKTGKTRHARINRRIASYLGEGQAGLVLWRKDDADPHAVKAELKSVFSCKWII